MSRPRATALLKFRIAGTEVALPLGVVREVIERPRVVPVPGSHPHVAGVALARGLALPVYDLGRFERLWVVPPTTGDESAASLIVCAWGEVLIGLLGREVDLIEAGTIPEDSGEAVDQSGADVPFRSGYARRVAPGGRDRVMILEAARLFASMGIPDPRVREAGEEDGEKDPAGR